MSTSYRQIKSNAVTFLEQLRAGADFTFRFSSANRPNLIGSALAVMLGGLLGWLEKFNQEQKKAWADYLNSFQKEDGFFEDINDNNRVPGYTKERFLFHRSRHALFALTTLGYKPKRYFSFLKAFLDPSSLARWTDALDLKNFWDAGNKIMDLGIFLSYEAKVNSDSKAIKAINLLLDICDKNTDPETGYQDAGKSELRNAMAGAMHLYPLYFLWGRQPKYPDKVIKTTISLQQNDGFFAYETGTCGEDCLDYDATSILVNFYYAYNFCHRQIRGALEKLLSVIGKCENPDGGFCCHRRNEQYRFGTFTTQVPIGGSSLWSTYSRILTIALAAKIAKKYSAVGHWNLGNNLMEIWDGGAGQMKTRL